jgi:hypothetical protein
MATNCTVAGFSGNPDIAGIGVSLSISWFRFFEADHHS